MKRKILLTTLMALIMAPSAFAKSKNLCDKLIDEERATDADINNCFSRLGKSDYRKDLERRLKIDEDRDESERQQIARLRDLLKEKSFTLDDLKEEFFGQTILITKVDAQDPTDEDYIYHPDRVCRYLGFQKSSKVLVPDIYGEFWADDAKNRNAMTLVVNHGSDRYDNPFVLEDYDPFWDNHMVKPLLGITCHKTIDGSKEALELLDDDPERIIVEKRTARSPRDDENAIDDTARSYQPRKANPSRYSTFMSPLSRDDQGSATSR